MTTIRKPLFAFAVSFTLSSAAVTTARAAEAPAAPPPEVKQLLAEMAGTWTAKEVSATFDGKTVKATSKVSCDKSAAGLALTCKVRVDMGAIKVEEVAIIGWDRATASLHLFSVNSDGSAHDHKGTFVNNVLALEYGATADGKPLHEALSFTFKGPKEMLWRDVYQVGGQEVFSGEGTYKK
jgi:hypothetical protein